MTPVRTDIYTGGQPEQNKNLLFDPKKQINLTSMR